MTGWLEFHSRPLWLNLGVFAICAAVVWLAGSRVARYADRFAAVTGVGHTTVGLVLLAGITSLPEVAVSLTSAAADNPALAVNNLLGAVSMQIAMLAVADAMLGREALTVVAGTSAVLLQVNMDILLLMLFAAVVVVGDVPLFGIGVGAWALLLAYALAIRTIARAEGRQVWFTRATAEQAFGHDRGQQKAPGEPPGEADLDAARGMPLGPLLARMALAAGAILAAGFVISRAGEAIALQTGLGASFVGAVLLAFATSLPEFSVVFAAMRLKRYQMAIADIFGTCLFNLALVFAVDAVYSGPPVLNEVGQFSLFAALLAALMTGIYLAGLLEQRDRTFARMGIDSFAVLALYLGGLLLLYRMR